MSEREGWIWVPGWEKFQHRDNAKSKRPIWIKVYLDLLDKDEFWELSFHLRGVLISLWLEYARTRRQLRDNTLTLTRRLGHRVATRDLNSLKQAGFIDFHRDAAAEKPRLEIEKEKTFVQDGDQEREGGDDEPRLRVVS